MVLFIEKGDMYSDIYNKIYCTSQAPLLNYGLLRIIRLFVD